VKDNVVSPKIVLEATSSAYDKFFLLIAGVIEIMPSTKNIITIIIT